VTSVFDCRSAEGTAELQIDERGLMIDGRTIDWLDVDDVRYDGHDLTFVLPDGERVQARGLGSRADECGALVRELRGRARRPALTQSDDEPIEVFQARQPVAPDQPPVVVDVVLLPRTLLLEPRGGSPQTLPLALVRNVSRDGHAFTLHLRGSADVRVGGLGSRTDEFAARLAEARSALAAATSAAYAALDPALSGLSAPCGWAVGPSDAGDLWASLLATWQSRARGAEASWLIERAGSEGTRAGLWIDDRNVGLPFLLASVGREDSARVAVEAVDADDRATFVFATDDIERLNAALVLTSFRRDAIALPEDALGRWAPAVRTIPAVRWMRERLVDRIVHDAQWSDAVASALTC
jgi:hypothetical protein